MWLGLHCWLAVYCHEKPGFRQYLVRVLDLLRRLLLHGVGDPELGPLVRVFQVERDDRGAAQRRRRVLQHQKLRVEQGLDELGELLLLDLGHVLEKS